MRVDRGIAPAMLWRIAAVRGIGDVQPFDNLAERGAEFGRRVATTRGLAVLVERTGAGQIGAGYRPVRFQFGYRQGRAWRRLACIGDLGGRRLAQKLLARIAAIQRATKCGFHGEKMVYRALAGCRDELPGGQTGDDIRLRARGVDHRLAA